MVILVVPTSCPDADSTPSGKLWHYTTLADFLDIHSQSGLWDFIDSCLGFLTMASPTDDCPALLHDPLLALDFALAALKPNVPTVTLKCWLSNGLPLDQDDEFQLFFESPTSWFHLQGVPGVPRDNGDRKKHVLDSLVTLACRKFNQLEPVSATQMTVQLVWRGKSAEGFLNYLSPNMDYDVSQWCQVLAWGCLHAHLGMHDEFVNCINVLVDWCNYPTHEDKEVHIQF